MADQRMGRFHEHFAQRRVGMDVAGDLGRRDLHELGQAQLGQQFGDIRADQVGAQDFAVAGVGDDLDEADALVERLGLAVGHERELAHLDLVARGLGLCLGHAQAGNLRVTVGAARHELVAFGRDGQRLRAGDGLGGHHAHGAGHVGQGQLAGAVADGIDVGHVGAHVLVHVDEAVLVHGHAGRVQRDLVGVGLDADGHEHLVGGQRLLRYRPSGS